MAWLQDPHPGTCTVPSIAVPHDRAYEHHNSLPNTYVCLPGQIATHRDPFTKQQQRVLKPHTETCWSVRVERLRHHIDSTASSQGRIPHIGLNVLSMKGAV